MKKFKYNHDIISFFKIFALATLLLLFIEYFTLIENLSYYQFKSNILNVYSDNRNTLLTGHFTRGNIFFDLFIAIFYTILVIIVLSSKFKNYKFYIILFLTSIFIIIFLTPIYKIDKVLDEDIYFSLSRFDFFKNMEMSNPFISNHISNQFMIKYIKFINFFTFNSFYTVKIVNSLLYTCSIFYLTKILDKTDIHHKLKYFLLFFFYYFTFKHLYNFIYLQGCNK